MASVCMAPQALDHAQEYCRTTTARPCNDNARPCMTKRIEYTHGHLIYIYIYVYVYTYVYVYIYRMYTVIHNWFVTTHGRHPGHWKTHEGAYLLPKKCARTNMCPNTDYRHPTTHVGDCSMMFISMMDRVHRPHHIRKTSCLILDHIHNALVQNCNLAGISCVAIAGHDSMVF